MSWPTRRRGGRGRRPLPAGCPNLRGLCVCWRARGRGGRPRPAACLSPLHRECRLAGPAGRREGPRPDHGDGSPRCRADRRTVRERRRLRGGHRQRPRRYGGHRGGRRPGGAVRAGRPGHAERGPGGWSLIRPKPPVRGTGPLPAGPAAWPGRAGRAPGARESGADGPGIERAGSRGRPARAPMCRTGARGDESRCRTARGRLAVGAASPGGPGAGPARRHDRAPAGGGDGGLCHPFRGTGVQGEPTLGEQREGAGRRRDGVRCGAGSGSGPGEAVRVGRAGGPGVSGTWGHGPGYDDRTTLGSGALRPRPTSTGTGRRAFGRRSGDDERVLAGAAQDSGVSGPLAVAARPAGSPVAPGAVGRRPCHDNRALGATAQDSSLSSGPLPIDTRLTGSPISPSAVSHSPRDDNRARSGASLGLLPAGRRARSWPVPGRAFRACGASGACRTVGRGGCGRCHQRCGGPVSVVLGAGRQGAPSGRRIREAALDVARPQQRRARCTRCDLGGHPVATRCGRRRSGAGPRVLMCRSTLDVRTGGTGTGRTGRGGAGHLGARWQRGQRRAEAAARACPAVAGVGGPARGGGRRTPRTGVVRCRSAAPAFRVALDDGQRRTGRGSGAGRGGVLRQRCRCGGQFAQRGAEGATCGRPRAVRGRKPGRAGQEWWRCRASARRRAEGR